MKLVNLAGAEPCWRGYEYYKEDMVISHAKIDEGVYCGKVRGSDNAIYNVMIDINYPRNSSCDCPFANGRRVICKHAVALYFTIFPDDAATYKAQIDKEEAEYEAWEEELPKRVEAFIRKLSKKELQDQLIGLVLNSEGWILDRYIRDHDIGEN